MLGHHFGHLIQNNPDKKKETKMFSLWQGWLSELLGIWLTVAPLVSLDVPSVKLNNLFVGVLAAIVSGYTPAKKLWVCWPGLVAGAWIAFTSSIQFFVRGEGYFWNNVISGALIFTSGLLVRLSFQNHAIPHLHKLKLNNQSAPERASSKHDRKSYFTQES